MGRGHRLIDLTGSRFGRWLVLAREPGLNSSRQARWRCRCDCGTERVVTGLRLRGGTSRSCGCARDEMWSERLTTHGLSKHRLFPTWVAMMARCYRTQNRAYPDYGGRGITVCERWHDVVNFIADNDPLAGLELSMDRRDNDGPYSPANVRWTTRTAQAFNRRSNVLLTFEGRTQALFDWARQLGMAPRTLWARIDAGWSVGEALTTPVDASNRRVSMTTFRGETKPLASWARTMGLPYGVVRTRIHILGWSVDRALTTPKALRTHRHQSLEIAAKT